MRRRRSLFLIVLVMLVVTAQLGLAVQPARIAKAADNGLAQRPYMGWSSYSMQVYSGDSKWINAAQIMAQSDAMHEKLQAHGYNYINIDAGWNGGMDEYGRPVPSQTLYPNGLQEVIDHVHANGQKIGLYMIPGLSKEAYEKDLPIYGAENCSARDIAAQPLRTGDYWNIGLKIDFSNSCAQSYIDSIADMLGEWGIDFLKFDSVTPGSGHNDTSIDARDDVAAWSKALKPHGIWFELSWALDHNYADYWKKHANGWRIDWDVECYCENVALTNWNNIARLFPLAATWWRDAGPGGWNDFDSLNIGNGAMDGLTPVERQTAMTFWSVSSAQLFTGNDLTNLDEYGLSLLTNDEAIAVNQAGHPAHPVSLETKQQVWYANNGDGTLNVALFNLGDSAASVTASWKELGITGSVSVRDLWSHSELGVFEDGFTDEDIPAHGSRLLKLTVQKGGTVSANDDDTDMRYDGVWQRNGGLELAAASQKLAVKVTDSSVVSSGLDPAEAVFDKKADAQTDITTKVIANGNTLTGITFGGNRLKEGTDYTVTDNTVTIRKEFLALSPVGTVNLIFMFSGGKPQTFSILVKDTTIQNSSVNPGAISFDKGDGDRQPVTAKLSLRGNTLTGITNGGVPLTPDTDYTVAGDTVTFKEDYLFALPEGSSPLTFTFSGGTAKTIALTIRDTSKGGSYTINDTDSNIAYHGPWNYSYNRNLGDYRDDVHFLEADGEYFEYTFQGTGIEVFTELDPSQGAIDFYMDGDYKMTVNAVNTGRLTQQAVFSTAGLEAGTHTVKAVKKSGWFMLLDKLRVTLPDLIAPAEASYDKAAEGQTGIVITLNHNGLTAIRSQSAPLASGSDYSVEANQVSIGSSYLAAQPVGTTKLTFDFQDGSTQTLEVRIDDSSAENSTIAPDTADFDRKTDRQSDVSTKLTWNGNTLLGIKNGGAALTAGTDYSISGDQLVISKAYLANQPVGTTKLIFTFSAGASQTLTVHISDTTAPSSEIRPSAASFDKAGSDAGVVTTIIPNGNTLAGITNGGEPLNAGEDYSVSGDIVTISREYLDAQPVGMTGLQLQFSAGQPQTLAIAVYDSALGRYVSLNDDASGIQYTGSWQTSRGRGLGDYSDDVHYTEKNGDYFEFSFTGTGIDIVTEKEGAQGDIEIWIDGVQRQTISTYNPSRLVKQTVFVAADLPYGPHTLKAVKKSGYYMLLDQLRYKVTDLITPSEFIFDKNDAEAKDVTVSTAVDESGLISVRNGEVSLSAGTDYTVNDNQILIAKSYLAAQPAGTSYLSFDFAGDFRNDVHASAGDGASVSYTFKGSGFSWIGPKGPGLGDIDFYVDGVYRQTVSAYHSSRQVEQTLFTLTGLAEGVHTVKAVKKSGDYLLADRLDYQVGAAGLELANTDLPDGKVGQLYEVQLAGKGGTGSYRFEVTGKGLPEGLTLSHSGNLSGTPEKPGMSKFSLTLTDEAGAVVHREFKIKISNGNKPAK
ncbi:X2-like carbohydrate binding domain-containing protein [Paenibacillus gansuensis]|uniref:Alpha-galactosidase n=1 Tax=Paenibacillus gansuensis TaxID=306542 RepID=A0ABW5P7E1_9BACL